jgi:hypothetical protein
MIQLSRSMRKIVTCLLHRREYLPAAEKRCEAVDTPVIRRFTLLRATVQFGAIRFDLIKFLP